MEEFTTNRESLRLLLTPLAWAVLLARMPGNDLDQNSQNAAKLALLAATDMADLLVKEFPQIIAE